MAGNIVSIKYSPELRCCDLSDMQWSTLATQIEIVVEYSMKQHRSMRQQNRDIQRSNKSFFRESYTWCRKANIEQMDIIYGRLHEIALNVRLLTSRRQRWGVSLCIGVRIVNGFHEPQCVSNNSEGP